MHIVAISWSEERRLGSQASSRRVSIGRFERKARGEGWEPEVEVLSIIQSRERFKKGIAESDQSTSGVNDMPSRRSGPIGSNSIVSSVSVSGIPAEVVAVVSGGWDLGVVCDASSQAALEALSSSGFPMPVPRRAASEGGNGKDKHGETRETGQSDI